jgi:NADH:ubiquinone oxidoreductase subunit D
MTFANSPLFKLRHFDFEVPIGSRGDVYDRYLVQWRRCDRAFALSSKYSIIFLRDLIRLTIDASHCRQNRVCEHRGLDEPFQTRDARDTGAPGEVHGYSEGGNGELGFT